MLIKKILSDESNRKMAATTAENYMIWLLQWSNNIDRDAFHATIACLFYTFI
jgi:hypothetical protein